MVKKWITRVLVLGIVVFVMFKTKGFFDDLADGTYAHEVLTVDNVYESNSSGKKTGGNGTRSSEALRTEPEVPEVVYEPSDKTGDDFYLDLSHRNLWESGEYSEKTGEKAEHDRRMRCPELISIECPKYNIELTEDYKLRICEYDEDKELIRCNDYYNGEAYEASKYGEFFSITIIKIDREQSLSPGQWGRVFGAGIVVKIYSDKWKDYDDNLSGSLIIGSTGSPMSEVPTNLLLEGRDYELAEYLWNEQIENGVYTLLGEELNNGYTTYYVSSSEGDDSNSGLSPEKPKKTLASFSGMSSVNVLVKCGDTFDLTNEINLGSNCIYAAYGQGSRPKLNFYRELNVPFSKVKGTENVWEANLSSLDICDSNNANLNCNIGQLIIDGLMTWNRYISATSGECDPMAIEKRGEGTWGVDCVASKLFIYCKKDPNNIRIVFASPSEAFTGDNIRNTVVKGFEVVGAGYHGCNLCDCENVEISCCHFDHIGGALQSKGSSRYGNAIQIWNSGKDIRIHNNFASQIYDTCFTNQGSDKEAVCEHIHFNDNIGSHFFWGIEVWGAGYSDNPFNDITYTGNILYDNIDVTNTNTPMHVNKNARPLGVDDNQYVSYRTGYKYHQMSGISVSNSGSGQVTKIENNIVWNSNRFLVTAKNDRGESEFSSLKNNLFYAEGVLKDACLLRYEVDGAKKYSDNTDYIGESNVWSVHKSGEKYDNEAEVTKLSQTLEHIGGKQ